MRSLLAARADPTPALMAAVQGDEAEVVFSWLASVADGEAGLDHAAEQDESVARMLLEAGADADGFGLLEAAAEAPSDSPVAPSDSDSDRSGIPQPLRAMAARNVPALPIHSRSFGEKFNVQQQLRK